MTSGYRATEVGVFLKKAKYFLVHVPKVSIRVLFSEGLSGLCAKVGRYIQQQTGKSLSNPQVFKVREKIGHKTDSIYRAVLKSPPIEKIKRTFPGSKLVASLDKRYWEIIKRSHDGDAIKELMKGNLSRELAGFLERGKNLVLPVTDSPDISILLVLYNQAPLTFACLKSIVAKANLPVEVVIVDNASKDETGRLLERLGNGFNIARNSVNAGFLKAVNQGAALANGKYLLLLNNDAVLTEGALERAVYVAGSDPKVGAVGARLILPDGRLQEAGSIIWNDGSCQGYGRGDDPEAGEYMFQREVDYCSGAFLLVKTEQFRAMGGFDELFAPAYYEEADFCMRLKMAGYKVVYDPLVKIYHYEFASSKKEKAVELQVNNHGKFVKKHREALKKYQLKQAPENILLARTAPLPGRRVLVLDDRVPHPWLGGGCPRAAEIIRCMVAAGWFCTLYPLQFPDDEWESVHGSMPVNVEVMLGRGVAGLERFMEVRAGYYNAFFVSRPHNMKTLDELNKKRPDLLKGMRMIYDAEAIYALRDVEQMKLMEGKAPSGEMIRNMVEKELELARLASDVIAVSPQEARYYKDAGFGRTHVLAHGIEANPSRGGFHDRHGFLFVGSLEFDPSPNTDSVIWFVNEILPLVAAMLGDDATLDVAGKNSSGRIRKLAGRRVKILGKVPDLTELYEKARVFVAPTRFSAGVPFKVCEAASRGVPVVATSLLAGQLGWEAGRDLLVADDPRGFADACIKLHSDEGLWKEIKENALIRVAAECSREAFCKGVKDILEKGYKVN